MSTNPPRTTTALLGDLLASKPGQTFPVARAAELLQRHRSGLDVAIGILVKAKLIRNELDPADRRRNVISMTPEQARAWSADAGVSCAAEGGFSLETAPVVAKAAAASVAKVQQRRATPLRFGVWSDGALVIDGLSRKQVTLPAADTGALALLFASFPEGALQALCDSPLKPSFALRIAGRDYPLTTEQAADLVAYIEQLPAKTLRTPLTAGLKHGTDHRSHRLADDEGDKP